MIKTIKKLLKLLTRPKITIFLKTGNVIRTRLFPFSSYNTDNMEELGKGQYRDIVPHENREALSYRKWYQKWA